MKRRYLRHPGARQRRQDLGLTLIAAAELMGVSKSNLSAWERGERHVPTRYWVGIEETLGLPPAAIWKTVASTGARRWAER